MMKFERLDPRRAEIARTVAVASLHERGVRTPTRAQIDEECQSVVEAIEASLGEGVSDAILVLDYTPGLLRRARMLRREGQVLLACVFYAMWTEHKLNQWVAFLARRRGTPSDEIDAIVRETQHRAKASWLLRLLGAPQLSKVHRARIQNVMDKRNAFVHYKWRQHRERELQQWNEVVGEFERTVKYMTRYEAKHIGIIGERKARKIAGAAR